MNANHCRSRSEAAIASADDVCGGAEEAAAAEARPLPRPALAAPRPALVAGAGTRDDAGGPTGVTSTRCARRTSNPTNWGKVRPSSRSASNHAAADRRRAASNVSPSPTSPAPAPAEPAADHEIATGTSRPDAWVRVPRFAVEPTPRDEGDGVGRTTRVTLAGVVVDVVADVVATAAVVVVVRTAASSCSGSSSSFDTSASSTEATAWSATRFRSSPSRMRAGSTPKSRRQRRIESKSMIRPPIGSAGCACKSRVRDDVAGVRGGLTADA